MKKFAVFTLIIIILLSSAPAMAYAGFGTSDQPVLSAEQICAAVNGYIGTHPEAKDDLLLKKRIVIGSWYKTNEEYWANHVSSIYDVVGVLIFTYDSTSTQYCSLTYGNKNFQVNGSHVIYYIFHDGRVVRVSVPSPDIYDTCYYVDDYRVTAVRNILLSTCDIDSWHMYGTDLKGSSASAIPDSLFGGISYDVSGSYTAAATSVINDTYFTLQCTFKSYEDKLNYSIGYCLPSNQYAKDLVSDLNGFLSGRIYTPIVSSSGYNKTYQKSQSIEKSVTFDYAIENWLYPETKVEQLVDGSYTAIFKVPYDKQELGTSALAGCPLSNISSYSNYQDRLVASGYVDSITSYVLSVENQQGPVHVFKYDDKLNFITNYQICQEVGSITEEINKEKEHEAYIEEVKNRAEENNKILDDKFLNDNMWKNGFESMKDFVSSGLTYVSSFAALIGGFLSFMPPWFVGFLYSAMVASIVIGIIKIIRG